MAVNQIQFSENGKKEITISVRRSNLFTRIVMSFFLIINVIAPFLILSMMAQDGSRLKLGNFIYFAILWGIAYYFFRLLCWNSFGKEIISFDKKINYHSDFKYFKDSQTEIDSTNITFHYEEIGYKEDNQGVLIIESDNDVIKSVIKVKMPELEEAIIKLESYIN